MSEDSIKFGDDPHLLVERYKDEIHFEIDSAWCGDTASGFGANLSHTLDKEQAVELAQWILQQYAAPEAARTIPDFDGMCDNAAGASQSRELLDDKITREAVKLNIYDPLVALLCGPQGERP